MAYVHMDFWSEVLHQNIDVDVLLPETRHREKTPFGDKKFKVLYLLHGGGMNGTCWNRWSRIEQYVAGSDLVVVMPTAHLSFYCNMVHGANYFKYFTEELPTVIKNYFPVSDKREDTYVAGLSMGGHGSLLLGLRRPDLYAGIGAMSCGRDWSIPIEGEPENKAAPRYNSLGTVEEFKGSHADIWQAVRDLKDYEGELPRIYHCCGKQDVHYESSCDFRDFVQNEAKYLDYTFTDGDGAHNFDYWDWKIQEILRYFDLVNNGQKMS